MRWRPAAASPASSSPTGANFAEERSPPLRTHASAPLLGLGLELGLKARRAWRTANSDRALSPVGRGACLAALVALCLLARSPVPARPVEPLLAALAAAVARMPFRSGRPRARTICFAARRRRRFRGHGRRRGRPPVRVTVRRFRPAMPVRNACPGRAADGADASAPRPVPAARLRSCPARRRQPKVDRSVAMPIRAPAPRRPPRQPVPPARRSRPRQRSRQAPQRPP